MSKKNNTGQTAENEVVEPETGFREGDSEPSCEGEPCDNVSVEEYEAADLSANLSAQVEEWKDKYLRLAAEFDNYRKRTLKEKMDLIATGGEGVIKPVLGVVDDFDRAMTAMQTSDNIDSIRKGMQLILQKLNDTLRSKGVTEIASLGLPLDTDLHEAVAKVPVEQPEQKGRIIDVVQKGYKLNDKVIRYAKVVVGE